LDPQQADVHYTLGVTLWQQGDFPGAADELHVALRAKPDYAEAWYTLGTVIKQQGKLQESANSLREAIRLQPDFAGAHTTLATVLRQLGDNQGAAAESKAGIEIGKEKTNEQAALFAANSGKRLLNAGDLDGAISQFRSAIGSAPGYAPAHFQLGLALQRKGQTDEAAKEFQKAAQLDPRLTLASH
jgi:tetratricopeptide (TPR) repeat protein